MFPKLTGIDSRIRAFDSRLKHSMACIPGVAPLPRATRRSAESVSWWSCCENQSDMQSQATGRSAYDFLEENHSTCLQLGLLETVGKCATHKLTAATECICSVNTD